MRNEEERDERSKHSVDARSVDLLVIGGGVNGTAVARDAAGRGLSVALCERDDLGAHTSSASSKLVHGGLRYLENFEFRLVREALNEREVLLRTAPHIVWPLRFVLPHDKGLRPKWMLRAGLFLYDHLARRRSLPGAKQLNLRKGQEGASLKDRFTAGFAYSDCWVEDSRLVLLNARDAADRGADILTRTKVVSVRREGDGFLAECTSKSGDELTIKARAVVNAAGMWVDDLLQRLDPSRNASQLRLVKGSHIVTRKLFDGEHAYIFQNADGRVIFAIPYEGEYTLVGTTDVPYDYHEGPPRASDTEIDYLLDAASEYFKEPVTRSDIVHTYSGVRPLYDDQAANASKVTRDYVLKFHNENSAGAPWLSVYGGKITTARKLGEHVMEALSPHFPGMGPEWTTGSALPGGEIEEGAEAFRERLRQTYPNVDQIDRLCRSYGTVAEDLLSAESAGPQSPAWPGGLIQAELDYLVDHEWAREADDVLWRRTKRGLHMSEVERRTFTQRFDQYYGPRLRNNSEHRAKTNKNDLSLTG